MPEKRYLLMRGGVHRELREVEAEALQALCGIRQAREALEDILRAGIMRAHEELETAEDSGAVRRAQGRCEALRELWRKIAPAENAEQ